MGSGKKVIRRYFYMIITDYEVTGYTDIQSARRSALQICHKTDRKSLKIFKVNRRLYGIVKNTKDGWMWIPESGSIQFLNEDGTTESILKRALSKK